MSATHFKTSVGLAGLAFAAALGVSAQAQVIYDSTGSGVAGYLSVATGGPLADSFTSPATATKLTGVSLLLTGGGGSGGLQVALYTSTGTPSPDSLVAVLGGISDSSITSAGSYSLSLVSQPVLSPNTRYWVGLVDPFSAGTISWGYAAANTGVGVSGEYWLDKNQGVTLNGPGANTPYSMTITVSAVPEPSAYAGLAGLGLVGWSLLRRVRR